MIHVAHLVSSILGDDAVGKIVRKAMFRLLGARIGVHTHLHGGTYLSRPAHLSIGDYCFLNRDCYLDADGAITIGDHVMIGHGVTMITTVHEIGPTQHRAGATSSERIEIGDGVWVGANATILPGVTVGNGAVVAAGAVVTRHVPANTLVMGVPARVARLLPTDEEIRIDLPDLSIVRTPPPSEHIDLA